MDSWHVDIDDSAHTKRKRMNYFFSLMFTGSARHQIIYVLVLFDLETDASPGPPQNVWKMSTVIRAFFCLAALFPFTFAITPVGSLDASILYLPASAWTEYTVPGGFDSISGYPVAKFVNSSALVPPAQVNWTTPSTSSNICVEVQMAYQILICVFLSLHVRYFPRTVYQKTYHVDHLRRTTFEWWYAYFFLASVNSLLKT